MSYSQNSVDSFALWYFCEKPWRCNAHEPRTTCFLVAVWTCASAPILCSSITLEFTSLHIKIPQIAILRSSVRLRCVPCKINSLDLNLMQSLLWGFHFISQSCWFLFFEPSNKGMALSNLKPFIILYWQLEGTAPRFRFSWGVQAGKWV